MIIKGKVKRGRGIGKTLGYPTANISCSPDLDDGVFYSLTRLGKNWKPSLLIKGVVKKGVEVYLINWSGDLYGKEIEVEILEKLRDIIHFDDVKELIKQIQEDVAKTKNYFKKNVHGNN